MPGSPEHAVATPPRIRLWTDLLRGDRLKLAGAALLALVSTGTTLAVPIVVKDVLTAFAQHSGLLKPVSVMVGLALVGAVTAAVSGRQLARLGEFLILRLRDRVMAHALRLPLTTVRAAGPGNLVARITSDAMVLRSIVDVGVVQLPIAVLTVVSTLVVMALLDWVLVLVTIGSFALAGAVIGVVMIRVRRNFVTQQTALGELAQRFTAALDALPTVKAYRAETRVANHLSDEAQRLTTCALDGARLQSLITPVLNLGQQLALVSVILGGGARIADGHLGVPEFAAFLLYLLQLVAPVTVVATGVGRLQAGRAAQERFDELLALPAEEGGEEAAGRTEPVAGAAAVEFTDVSFAHGAQPVLRGLSFAAPARGLTALVGASGAGKSTVLSLTDRFDTAQTGLIRVLGRDVHDWPLPELRRRVAYVDQAFTLLEGTVRENLELGSAEPLGDAVLLDTLDRVGLRQDVLRLPDGLDTVLGRATDLSGGQRQRLALARVLLTDADVILLDEPTSQLDAINEQRLRDLVDSLAETRAVVVVAHRLSTVLHADRVVLLDAGSVVDAGPHEDLLARCPRYQDLVTSQLGHHRELQTV
ncbi:ABC transporter ATP-binding protein [Streptomyces kaniharaensis]|uniref:ABC transporter ATP-binding protein n=1 Tax=Streptomyces kaniharaensis TaxID=212423 RepID=A0A6N7KNK3_9ACTN|nr:ABC transporter ATP-binding protein [Streptomyces kaniharaensis]MQS12991.1 ABC transporter ATP-binding protein [Streptomyces kaniharaensis]